MVKSISIRCIKMIATGAEVLLYRDFDGDGFNLLCKEFTCLERNLSYVELKDVTFDIYEDKKELAHGVSERTVHAVARGTLIQALPENFDAPLEYKTISRLHKLREIDYKPSHEAFFFTTDDMREIHSAKFLYAVDGKVKVLE